MRAQLVTKSVDSLAPSPSPYGFQDSSAARPADSNSVMTVASPGNGILGPIVLIVLFWFTIFAPGLFSPPLLDDADARHAEAAKEMLERHDFVTMYVDGVRYLDKAPLPYWLNAASHAVFGINEFAVRLPMSLAALGLFLSVFFLGRNLGGKKAGMFAALIVATAVGP